MEHPFPAAHILDDPLYFEVLCLYGRSVIIDRQNQIDKNRNIILNMYMHCFLN